MLHWIRCLLILSFICGAMTLSGEEKSNTPVQITLVHEEQTIQPGRPFWVALHVKLDDKWHSYMKMPGGNELANCIDWNLPEGFTVSPILWPEPKKFSDLDGVGYEKEILLLAQITPPETISSEASVSLSANIKWVACSDTTCVPGESQVVANLMPSEEAPMPHAKWASVFQDARGKQFLDADEKLISMADVPAISGITPSFFYGEFGMALLLALLGGFILNLMPCVLPVISFKILSFVKMSGQSRSMTLKHGLAFSFGVLVSFWVLAALLLMLQAYGHSVGWGFQLQEPLFVALLASVLLIFGLSLFGVFETGNFVMSLAGKAGNVTKDEVLSSSFFSGVLATAVATPCTGPFLGSAIGFAVTVPAPMAMLIFTFLGIGMAFPYLLLSAYPNLMRFLPKPGNWMITFKEIMGFIMVATVLWLVWVFSAQTSNLGVIFLLAGFFCLSIGCWVYGKWGCPTKARLKRYLSMGIAICCFFAGGATIYYASMNQSTQDITHAEGWETFSPARVAELRKQGIPVFIDFTAKWCLICQTNHLALSSKSVEQKFKELGVVKMKADWTKRDAVITEELKKFGRNGVPLYLLYGKNPEAEAVVLPQVLTPDTVVKYLSEV